MKFLKIKDDTYLNISLISEVQFGKRPKREQSHSVALKSLLKQPKK